MDSNPSSPASIGRKETKGRRKQSYPSKAPTSPDVMNYQHESSEEQAQDFTSWSSKIKGKVWKKKLIIPIKLAPFDFTKFHSSCIYI